MPYGNVYRTLICTLQAVIIISNARLVHYKWFLTVFIQFTVYIGNIVVLHALTFRRLTPDFICDLKKN